MNISVCDEELASVLNIFDIFKLRLGKLVYQSINDIGMQYNTIQ